MNGERVYAEEIGKWLNHEDESQDLAVQNFFVENNESAKSAIHIACFAVGAIAKQAYKDQGIPRRKVPEVVELSDPLVVVIAITEYKKLLDKRLVPKLK